MKTQKPQEKITVLRRIAVYEEAVFNSIEEFEEWKKLMNWMEDEDSSGKYDKFCEINESEFADIGYSTEDHEPVLYVAIKGDIRDCSDDWIHQNIFDKAVDDTELESIPLFEGFWQELLFDQSA